MLDDNWRVLLWIVGTNYTLKCIKKKRYVYEKLERLFSPLQFLASGLLSLKDIFNTIHNPGSRIIGAGGTNTQPDKSGEPLDGTRKSPNAFSFSPISLSFALIFQWIISKEIMKEHLPSSSWLYLGCQTTFSCQYLRCEQKYACNWRNMLTPIWAFVKPAFASASWKHIASDNT